MRAFVCASVCSAILLVVRSSSREAVGSRDVLEADGVRGGLSHARLEHATKIGAAGGKHHLRRVKRGAPPFGRAGTGEGRRVGSIHASGDAGIGVCIAATHSVRMHGLPPHVDGDVGEVLAVDECLYGEA